jgi:hypothetical protein
MDDAPQLAAAMTRKEKGNAAYKAGSLSRAARQYNAAVEAATSINERDMGPPGMDGLERSDAAATTSTANLMSQAREVKKACMNNWAAVELKRQNWSEAAKQAGKVHTGRGGGLMAASMQPAVALGRLTDGAPGGGAIQICGCADTT